MAQKKLANRHQVAEIVAMLAKGDIEFDLAQAIIEKKVGVTEKSRKLTPTNALEYSALVEYRQPSYDELKKAFDWVYDGYKNAEFKQIDVCKDVSTETREIEFELVHLNKDASTDTVLAELDKRELRPALYEELLAFAAKYPEFQKQFPIGALGSVCRYDDYLCSPCVSWYDEKRYLSFHWIAHGWLAFFRFLAMRKQP
jgi:hypothetical protein